MLRIFPSVLAIDFAVTGVVMFLVHIFFASRLFLLGKGWWLPGIIAFCSIATMGLYISILAEPWQPTNPTGLFSRTRMKTQISVSHFLSAFVDILLTIGLCVAFSPGKSEFKRTKMVLHRLLMYSITRGILTALVQIGHVAMYLIDPSKFLFWISLHLPLSKLYVITTLVILNSRPTMRKQLDEDMTLGAIPLYFAHSASTPDDTGAHPTFNVGHLNPKFLPPAGIVV